MASRLSDISAKESYESGIRGLPLSPASIAALLKPLDLDSVVNGPMPAATLQALPSQLVYQALKLRGLNDSLDALALLSREQFIRMIDYDAWDKDGLVPRKVFEWLRAYANISRKALYARYISLDEELQVALLQGRLEVFDIEAVEQMSADVSDALRPMPCNQVFYHIKNCERDEEEMIVAIIETFLEHNLPMAYSLLEHAHWLPPQEAEFQLQQFRKARLEEDGFVDYDESLLSFVPIEVNDQVLTELLAIKKDTEQSVPVTSDRGGVATPRLFLDEAFSTLSELSDRSLDDLELSYLHLANSLCAAAHLAPDDLDGLKYALLHAKSLASIGLEYSARCDRLAAAELVASTHAKVLFRTGLGVVKRLQERVFDRLRLIDVPDLERARQLHALGRHGQLLFDIDTKWSTRLGLELSEALKGLFNRFPTRAEFYSEVADTTPKMRVRFVPFSYLGDLAAFAQLLDQWFENAETRDGEMSRPTTLN